MSRAALLLLLMVAFVACAAPALGQEPPAPSDGPIFRSAPDAPPAPPPREIVRLIYAAPPGCPDQQALRTSLAARLGYDPVNPAAPRVLRVSFARAADGFSATAELRDPAGHVLWTRPALADADCRALVDVMGLALKFVIDPSSSAAQPAAPPPIVVMAPAAPTVTAPSADPGRPDSTSPPPSSRPMIRLGLRAAGALGTGPAPTGSFTADLGVGWTHFSLAVEGRADVPATGTVDEGVQLRTWIAAGSLVPCGHKGWFFGCGVFTVGGLWAEGVSTLHPAVGTAIYAVAGPRAGLEWPLPFLPSLSLRASLDVLVTVHPITARVDGAHIWPTPPFAGLLGGGFVLKI